MGSALSELKLSIERGYVVERKAAECEKTVMAFENLLKTREDQLMDLTNRCSKITMQLAIETS